MAKLKILGIAGSLREHSFNRGALRAAQQLISPDAEIEIFDIKGIPPFSEDDEKNPPAQVTELKQKIRESDGILFVTPEYNYSIPGVLKNAIDWASRPYGDSAWANKPVAIMGASVGPTGTLRAQNHLRQVFVFLNMHDMKQPEMMIASAGQKFDAAGNLTDETTRQYLKRFLDAYVAHLKNLHHHH